MKKIRRKKQLKTVLLLVIIILLYEVIGMLIPFVHLRTVRAAKKQSMQTERFYAGEDRTSTQRACVAETNQEALAFRLDLFERATERIVLSTFDIRPGKSTDDIFASLYAAADRGVKVQIIVDGMYGALHMAKQDMFYAAGMHPNIEIRFYNTPNPLKPWTINGRMHDKYIVVDQEYLLMGGRNTFDYFVGDYTKSKGYDREVFVMADGAEAGSAVHQADEYFRKMWDNEVCRPRYEFCADGKKKGADKAAGFLKEHYSEMKASGVVKKLSYETMTVPVKKASFIHNPTHIYGKEPYIFEELKELMAQAKERVVIHTPYIVCSKDMYEGLKKVSEKVPDCELIVNSIASGDNVCASSDYLRHRDDVLSVGFTVQEYMGKHSTHGKSVLIDDNISVIGSYNFDNRSTYVDTETMLVIDSKELNAILSEKFDALRRQSLEVQADGTYKEKEGVAQREISGRKNAEIHLLSILIQPFRYLI